MHKLPCLLVCCLLLASTLAAESFQAVALQYEPGARVLQTHNFEWTLDLDIPGNPLKNRVAQSIDCELRVLGEDNTPIEEAPFNIELVLHRVVIDLNTNGVERRLDSSEEGNSPHMALIRHLIGRPVRLEVGRDYALPTEIEDLRELYHRLPQLAEMLPESMLHEMFQSMVCLSGQALTAGTTRLQQITVGAGRPLSTPVNYEVVRANYKDVEAEIKGQLPEQTQKFGPALGDKQLWSAAVGDLKLASSVRGKVTWRRRNALVCQLKLQQDYNGSIALVGKADEAVSVRGQWTHRIQSKRL